MLLALTGLVALPSVAAAAGTGSITLAVVSARDSGDVRAGDAVTAYHWLVTADDVGDPHDTSARCLPPRAGVAGSTADFADQANPDACRWPSIRYTPGTVPVMAQGDQGDLSASQALDNLPPGRYLVSVTADNYKIDGAHFTVADGGTTNVTVAMQPYPLPLGAVRIRVFNDTVPVDGTYEVGTEDGLAGFTAHLSDVMGEVTTDYYGNPLCTTYRHDADGKMVFDDGSPVIAADSTGKCVSDASGDIVIPNIGPDRYAATVVAPTGSAWVQTTTLEGGHDWDVWVQEGDTGFDTEQTLGGEPVPFVDFGFVSPKALPAGGATGEIVGTAVLGRTYVGGQGGVTLPNGGVAGANIAGPVSRPWVALSDLGNGDQMVHLAQGGADGRFDITGVPDGDYQITLWDGPQETILDSFNVTVSGGHTVDIGNKILVGWFTEFKGSVFIDTNANGRRDAGEVGVPGFPVALKERDNSTMDQGISGVTTDHSGNYDIRQAYPLSKWLVLEAFNTRYKTTGITYQADNQPTPTTLLGAAVDVNVLPIIGLSGRVDWGVQPYNGAESGGIAGTVTYDTTRNEMDPRFAVTEPYQPGIPDVQVHLYAVVRDPTTGDPVTDPETGGYVRGPELNDAYTAETWDSSSGCTARMFDGTPLTDQLALPDFGPDAGHTCVESPMMGVQVRPSDTTPGNFGQTVNGNYAFADSKLNLYPPGDPDNPAPDHMMPLYAPLPDGQTQPLPPDDYLVEVVPPDDPVDGKPMYQVTREEDVNIFDGDGYLPQENFPPDPTAAGDPPAGAQPQPDPGAPPSQGNGINPPCAGALHTVHVTDQAFVDGGGSPFEGQQRPLCDVKLVSTRGGQAVAPNFNMFTQVPLPTHFWGLVINDLGLSHDKRSIAYGEAAPLPDVPVGLYDWAGRLVDTVDTDFNGFYEAIEPSTSTYNCPLPAGPCPNMYRFVGNDPGQPGHLNHNYNPRFRTIATNFQAWPGLYTVTDTAPTQVGVTALAPGGTQINPVDCAPAADVPQLFAVSRPYVRSNFQGADRRITITGQGFGATQGTGGVTLTRASDGTTNQPLTVNSWNDRQITVTLGPNAFQGPAVLAIRAGNGQRTVNGLTVQMLASANGSGNANNPIVRNVNRPGPIPSGEYNYTGIQAALEAAAAQPGQDLVVVWPHAVEPDNPTGAYFENVVIHSPVRLQGVGPGGQYADGTYVPGSVINGLGFNPDNDRGTAWVNLVGSLTYAGPTAVPDGAVVTVLAGAGQFTGSYPSSINGFTITGGTQADFATNINTTTGGTTTPYGAPGAAITQGGGVYLHAAADYVSISDNVIVGNSGSYGGGVRVGTPYVDSGNDNVAISRNRIRDNGGTNLAGGVGIFAGSTGYSVDHNDLCGNFSAEYGGGISHFGRSNNGRIVGNRLWLNQSYDEAGGIMVAGELPAQPDQVSPGSGPVTIDANVIQDNLANDDGGGIRALQAGNFPVTVTNNMIVNNISAHEGGGIALDDAVDVRLVNNTVIGNITTATAVTSNGQPAPAGLSSTANSTPLQATLPSGAPTFSDPKMFNNIFWNNRAGNWNGLYVSGIGAPDAPAGDPVRHWDMGVAGGGGTLSPTYSILQTTTGTATSGTNLVGVDPHVVSEFATSVIIETSRTFPSFRQAVIVVQAVPATQMGDYHLAAGSPAIDAGTASRTYTNPFTVILAPTPDIDGQFRPLRTADIGADEYY